MSLSSHIFYQIKLHQNGHQMTYRICLLQRRETLNWILVQWLHIYYKSEIHIGESTILRQSKNCETRVLFTLDWQWMEDSVQQFWDEDGWRFKGYVKYIFSLWNKIYDWVRCDDCEIDQRYYENVETSVWMLKCNVRFMLTITYVMFHFSCYQC